MLTPTSLNLEQADDSTPITMTLGEFKALISHSTGLGFEKGVDTSVGVLNQVAEEVQDAGVSTLLRMVAKSMVEVLESPDMEKFFSITTPNENNTPSDTPSL